MASFSYNNVRHALVLGAGDLGRALCHEILTRQPQCQIFMTTRDRSEHSLPSPVTLIEHDLDHADSWSNLYQQLKKHTSSLDLIISTWGFLHDDQHRPEKSLRDLEASAMMKSFTVNAFSAPLAAQTLEPFLSKERASIFAFLSAKVGSITDNKLGGWYSYRASKAALNMFLKTISIEWQRKKYLTSVMAIHPGTTETRLSTPFLKHFNLKVWQPHESAQHICDVLETSYEQGTGLFKNWDHSTLPW